jgi:rfaE bifunctional protein nucleotidyltransferase chain/domain/rfaE bifunctional protein kinase chain/domain
MSARRGHVVVIGDALLDRDLEGTARRVSPEGPVPVVDDPQEHSRPGGAALAAALAAADGWPVTLITALARDEAGTELRASLERMGVDVVDAGLEGPTPEKVRVRAHGQTVVRLDRGSAPGRLGPLPDAGRKAIARAGAVLVSDYGRGITAKRDVRAALQALPASVPVVWDPHPRGPDPVRGTLLVTPNRGEALAFAPAARGDGLPGAEHAARMLIARWGVVNVCVTLGSAGALLVGGPAAPLAVPAPMRTTGDASGAGDRFASRVACLLADGALVSDAVAESVAPATDFVASGGASRAALAGRAPVTDGPSFESAEALAARVRRAGGTVVATGGCFDLLHAGHVRMLASARALGDCLIVCLNSDESVTRLKGPGRPVVGEPDRIAVLSALECVDAVAVFGEPTPERLLERLRPHLFAKGGDYRLEELPEAPVLERWGGRAVILPYVAGRSTTRMIAEAAAVAS